MHDLDESGTAFPAGWFVRHAQVNIRLTSQHRSALADFCATVGFEGRFSNRSTLGRDEADRPKRHHDQTWPDQPWATSKVTRSELP